MKEEFEFELFSSRYEVKFVRPNGPLQDGSYFINYNYNQVLIREDIHCQLKDQILITCVVNLILSETKLLDYMDKKDQKGIYKQISVILYSVLISNEWIFKEYFLSDVPLSSFELNLLSMNFQIEIVKASDTEMQSNDGVCDYLNQVIKIRVDLSRERTKKTILHEIVHFILRETGIEDMVGDRLEDFCDLIALGLHDFFERNKYLVKERILKGKWNTQ